MSLKEQIIAVRDSGKTNMLDSRTVQYIASEMNFDKQRTEETDLFRSNETKK